MRRLLGMRGRVSGSGLCLVLIVLNILPVLSVSHLTPSLRLEFCPWRLWFPGVSYQRWRFFLLCLCFVSVWGLLYTFCILLVFAPSEDVVVLLSRTRKRRLAVFPRPSCVLYLSTVDRCGCTNSGHQVAQSPNFCTVTPNTYGFSVESFLHVTLLASTVFGWLLDFCKIYGTYVSLILV